jgi:hypothetical protein
MRVSQVAFDRFVVELPEAEPDYVPLRDPQELDALVRWLWDFGRPPVLALVGGDPAWCQSWSPRRVSWVPGDADVGATEIAWDRERGGHALVLENDDELRRFLLACPAISRIALMWPRIDLAKTFMKLAENNDWRPAAEAVARLAAGGSRIEVQQLS